MVGRRCLHLLGALTVVVAGCTGNGSGSGSDDARPVDTGRLGAEAVVGTPPSPPSTGDVGVLELSIDVDDSGHGVVTTQLVNRSSSRDLADTRMRVLQRWDGAEWVDVALLPYRARMMSPAAACPPDGFDECASDADDPPDLAPGESGGVRMFAVTDLAPGVYRTIERPDDQGAASDHVELP